VFDHRERAASDPHVLAAASEVGELHRLLSSLSSPSGFDISVDFQVAVIQPALSRPSVGAVRSAIDTIT
jgi:hypothetical protein